MLLSVGRRTEINGEAQVRIDHDAIQDVLDDAAEHGYDIETSALCITEQRIDDRTGERVLKLEYRFRSRDDDPYEDERFLREAASVRRCAEYREHLINTLFDDVAAVLRS